MLSGCRRATLFAILSLLVTYRIGERYWRNIYQFCCPGVFACLENCIKCLKTITFIEKYASRNQMYDAT